MYPVIEYLPRQSCQLNSLPYLKILYNAKLQYCVFPLPLFAQTEEIFHMEITDSCRSSSHTYSSELLPAQKSLGLRNTCRWNTGTAPLLLKATEHLTTSYLPMYIRKEKAGHLGNLFSDKRSDRRWSLHSLEHFHKGKLRKVRT